jgi:cardiolipin synthase
MAEGDEDRILTVPNALTALRLLGLPVFLWLLFAEERRFAAAVLLSVLAASDCADGIIARRFNQVSELGKVLDPVVDRVLLAVGGAAIVIDGSVPLWVAALALVRELSVAAGTIVLALKGAARIDVKLVGRAANFLLMTAFPLFLVSNPDGGASWHEVARVLAWLAAVPGLVLSWYAALRYIPDARDALTRGRVGSHGTGTGIEASSDMLKERTS